jgi:hypothetical protein
MRSRHYVAIHNATFLCFFVNFPHVGPNILLVLFMVNILYRLTYPLTQTYATWPAYIFLEFVALIIFDGEKMSGGFHFNSTPAPHTLFN